MSKPIPSALALNTVVNGTTADATPVESNFTNIQTAVNGLITALDGGVLGQFLEAVDGTDVQYAYPPGYEIGYDQITANVNIVSTSSASPTTIIAGSAHTFDGSPVICKASAPLMAMPQSAGGTIFVSLMEGATGIAQIAQFTNPAANISQAPLSQEFRFTPSAGSHTYSLVAWVNNTTGGPAVVAGAGGGTGTYAPAFLRFSKV